MTTGIKHMANVKYWPAMLLLCLPGLNACKKAENYYEKLHDQPEILLNYDAVYGVGDTLIMDGRLSPENDLRITIGHADARIVAQSKILYTQPGLKQPDTIDRVKMIITEEMGIGTNRQVVVASTGGNAVGTAIEIVESSSKGYLPHPLQIAKVADFPAGGIPLFCQNGKGSIYLWKPDKTITRIGKDGTTSIVMDAGTPGNFTIVTFGAGGVDPQEHYLYFSAVTTDNAGDGADSKVYRFCRYNLQTKELTTLNRSLYPNEQSQRTMEVFTPFEGAVGTARLHAVAGIYPAGNGQVYIRASSPNAIIRLDNAGGLKYLFKGNGWPTVRDPQTGTNYSSSYVFSIIPGVDIRGTSFLAIAPDEDLLYGRAGASASNITQFDLTNQVNIYSFTPAYVRPVYSDEKPYISGSFNILTGTYELSTPPALFGYLPLPGEKVLILYYQGLDNYPEKPFYAQYPALATLNFTERAGRRYAPGKLDRNGYVLQRADQMLNYDEEGRVYMTANNNSVIVKTQDQ